jgi:RNA polymerase sigma-70 factor (ECF subfamily)
MATPEIRDSTDPESAHADNSELLKLLDSDSERGARLLFRRFSVEVNNLVWRLLGADAEHNDIVQQVFFKALGSWRTLREPEHLGTWIRTITVNTVYQELRRRETSRLFARAIPASILHRDLVREVEARDFLRAALALIERLPPKERIVFVLRFVEEKAIEEVAELCQVSLGTVKRRLRRAEERFQSLAALNPEVGSFVTSELQRRNS